MFVGRDSRYARLWAIVHTAAMSALTQLHHACRGTMMARTWRTTSSLRLPAGAQLQSHCTAAPASSGASESQEMCRRSVVLTAMLPRGRLQMQLETVVDRLA